ncbi:hypothetical protein FB567DRAFT_633846 [Paraphoma chrysanthemicola]|uniref:Uncharacterized protein n=1 Tax=Paraphoma chrysanthemicola TaxID=798071 RepID=A0A8K0QVC1_9PLEO|nr:hypothetical protein FB567DRAFT_633846 [Paraphoma chrysanthemicola]
MSTKTDSAQQTPNPTSQPSPITSTTSAPTCTYHLQIIIASDAQINNNLNPMDRFLAEGPNEQSALFIRDDNDQLSTTKGCTCGN